MWYNRHKSKITSFSGYKYLPVRQIKISQKVKIRDLGTGWFYIGIVMNKSKDYISIDGIYYDYDDNEIYDIEDAEFDICDIGKQKNYQFYLIPDIKLKPKDFKEVF